ncbi:MAG TPA: DUF1634 domain-containing protein [Kofleriaceae bacterium]|jgi:uncharacterized membrane protein
MTALERWLARLYRGGTYVATAVIAIGIVLGSRAIEFAGIALFIALPIARVALLCASFVRSRDRTFALLAGVVLAIVAAGALVGAYGH